MAFADRVKELREARRLSQAALAALLGVSRITLWKWEKGQVRPTDRHLRTLAEVLGVSPRYLTSDPADSDHRMNEDASLRDAIRDTKLKLAALAGTDPAKVKILIEY